MSAVTQADADGRPERTAFVLAGGGSHGAVQVGMLRSLQRAGLRADLVVGTSVGAINGAFFASDPSEDGVNRLAAIWHALRRQDIYPVPVSSWLPLVLGRRAHLCDSRGLRGVIARAFGSLTFADLPVACALVATEFLTGEEVVLRDGPVGRAALASAAVPVVLPPVDIEGVALVDGALARNTPVRTAIALGATRVVILPTGFACGLRAQPQGAVATALHHVSVLFARQLAAETALARTAHPHVAVRVVPPLCPLPVSSYDFTSVRWLISAAEQTTDAWLAGGGADSNDTSSSLMPHVH